MIISLNASVSSPKFWGSRGEEERGRRRGERRRGKEEKEKRGRRGGKVFSQPKLQEIKLTGNLGSWSGSAFTLPII